MRQRVLAALLVAGSLLGATIANASFPIQLIEPPVIPGADESDNRDPSDPVAVWCAKIAGDLYGDQVRDIVVRHSAKWGTVWRASATQIGAWRIVCRSGDFALILGERQLHPHG